MDNPTTTTGNNQTTTLSLPPITLQSLSHLSDYIPDLQKHTNPLEHNQYFRPVSGFYITSTDVSTAASPSSPRPEGSLWAYHRAGPRREIFADPSNVRAAIVTCGGLCPGMNTVIRELVVGLWDLYGVREIYGVKMGYRGFYSSDLVTLDPKMVHNWHKSGGTMLEKFAIVIL